MSKAIKPFTVLEYQAALRVAFAAMIRRQNIERFDALVVAWRKAAGL